jgi:catechol-2,3-dioxygenase
MAHLETVSDDIPKTLGLHHFAWKCKNAEETRVFYEDILGLPLVHVIKLDYVPSTKEYCPYIHIFFQMQDGSCLAFFDLNDNSASIPSSNTPSWVNHIALKLDHYEDLITMKERLIQFNIDVIGPVDHGFIKSIYFFDPNGIRLEYSVQTASKQEMENHKNSAKSMLSEWLNTQNEKG